MYIHIGADIALKKDKIIAICDMDTTTVSKWTRQFLKYAQDMGDVIEVSDEIPRSFIIAENNFGENVVYLSPISSATLLKRSDLSLSDI